MYGDGAQLLLLASLLVFSLRNLLGSGGRIRRFWIFMSLWAGGWLCGTLIWSWFDIVAQHPVPDVFLGDMLFFLLPVALMAALAVCPHARQHDGPLSFTWLDFLLLLLFWIYLYTVAVIPWGYVDIDSPRYSHNFDLLYAVETAVPVLVLIRFFLRARGRWRRLYGMLLWGAATWAVAVQVVNHALATNSYYSGSPFDLGMVISTCIFIAAALVSRNMPQPDPEVSTRLIGMIASRLAMAAVLSLPFFAVWAYCAAMPVEVRTFRLATTGVAMVVLQSLVFLKKHLLDRELTHLWRQTQANYHNLKRSHDQLIQTERLAVLAQLVAVASHEINNPLTAIVGYSQLMADDSSLSGKVHTFITQILHQARRVTEAMNHLRQIAHQPLGSREILKVNQLLEEAIELRTLDIGEDHIEIVRSFAGDLPPVIGSSTQLLQVCFCLIGNAIEALRKRGEGTLSLSSHLQGRNVVVEITEDGATLPEVGTTLLDLLDGAAGRIPSTSSLAMSACYNILREHGGQLSLRNLLHGGSAFTLELPAAAQSVDGADGLLPPNYS